MPELNINNLNVVVAILGAFTVLFGLIAVKIKHAWYLGEALPAVAMGILLGPACAGVLDVNTWAQPPVPNQEDEITLGVMRIVIAIQLVLAGFQLPARYPLTCLRSLSVCLIPVMTLMWLFTSVCVLATLPQDRISFRGMMVIAACVTSTDPILSQAIAKGPFADRYVTRPLREIISAEAGANDGFGSPFVMLPVNLMVAASQNTGYQNAVASWVSGTLLYTVLMAVAYGAVVGFFARVAVRETLTRRWIDAESYLLFPTALGLLVVGTCGMIGTSDLLACFIAGCALNWDGNFLAETKRRHDEVNSCIDVILNIGGFTYIGIVIPWDSFHDPDGTGITFPRLLALGFLVLALRRIPAILITYRLMPDSVANWREAVFMGYFGPIGAGAVYYLENTRHMFFDHEQSHEESEFLNALSPAVYFLVLFSIVVHGLSIPVLSVIYEYAGVEPITSDAVELQTRSEFSPLPSNSVASGGDRKGTFIAYNRFTRPLYYLASLPSGSTSTV